MPLWLDLLRTPMAAPETRELKRMRLWWLVLLVALANAVGGFGLTQAIFGRFAGGLVLILLLATVIHGVVYLVVKHRADSAFLTESVEAAQASEGGQ